MMKSFEELECWKIGAEIRREVSRLVKKIPSQEKFALISQMLRCSRSVTNNIAEGYGRFNCIKILNGYIKYLLEAKINQQKS